MLQTLLLQTKRKNVINVLNNKKIKKKSLPCSKTTPRTVLQQSKAPKPKKKNRNVRNVSNLKR